MKKIAILAVVFVLFSGTAFAAKTTYIVTNQRFNYVKLKEVSGKVAEERKMTHPVTLDETGLRAALASINFSRNYLISKDVDTQQIFDERAVNFLAPNLVKAFAQAGPNEEIVFSFLSKNPLFIIRNDRLSICEAWIHDNELHIKFEKLYAKIFGDTDKRGNEARAIAKAQGLRVKLDLSEGQTLGVNDVEEIVLNLNQSYVKKPEEPKVPEAITIMGEKIPSPDEAQVASGEPSAKSKSKAKGKGEIAKAAETVAPPAPEVKTIETRLEELDVLKKKGLVNKKEYEEKKKEILKGL